MARNSTWEALKTERDEVNSFSVRRVGATLWELTQPYTMLADLQSVLASAASAGVAITRGTTFQVSTVAGGRQLSLLQWLGDRGSSSLLPLYYDEIQTLIDVLISMAAEAGDPTDLEPDPVRGVSMQEVLDSEELNATFAGLVQAAKNPDMLIAGAVTVDGDDLVTSAVVEWPNGVPGVLTITARDSNDAVLAYNITYGSPVTATFTQPTITRNANGAATNVPQIVVT